MHSALSAQLSTGLITVALLPDSHVLRLLKCTASSRQDQDHALPTYKALIRLAEEAEYCELQQSVLK